MSRARFLAGLSALMLLAGCGAPGPDSGESPEPVSPVYTDWSKLTPYKPAAPKPLYSRFEPYQGDTLTPRSDYGILIPYLGASLSVSNYITDSLPLYGLVTTDGRIVTEPVYASIYAVSGYTQGRSSAPFLLLQKGDPSAGKGNGRDSLAGEFSCTVAAPDGRWVRDFGIAGTEYVDEAHLAIIQPDNSVTVLSADGEIAAYFSGDAVTPYLRSLEKPYFGYEGSPYLSSRGDILFAQGYDPALNGSRIFCYLNLADGTVSADPPQGFSEELPYVPLNEENDGYSSIRDAVTGELYYFTWDDSDSAAPDMHILDKEKQSLLSIRNDDSMFYQPSIWNGLCAAVQDGAFCYYDLNSGECVFRFPLRSNFG
ncbi:hypothetical protein [uncultured Oscillibacter sp.]|uniref:hypothetical protein n=1 Tax=uncultured Oscillibacter sp. TaxID=876091 RepID=UPI0025EA289E|nr:hypothetical protein [uncultured Oscillibacter sp.]